MLWEPIWGKPRSVGTFRFSGHKFKLALPKRAQFWSEDAMVSYQTLDISVPAQSSECALTVTENTGGTVTKVDIGWCGMLGGTGPVTTVFASDNGSVQTINGSYAIQALYDYDTSLIQGAYYAQAYQQYVQSFPSCFPSVVSIGNYGTAARVAPTPEELERFERESKERKAQVDAAKARAEELLLVVLPPEQAAEYRKHGYFEVNVDTRRYRIHNTGISNNVELLGADGQPDAKYCIHVKDYNLPVVDNMLAQKLLLETDEGEFLRIANRTQVRGGVVRPVARENLLEG